MAGRMATLTLLPLSVSEILERKSRFPERCFAGDFCGIRARGDINLGSSEKFVGSFGNRKVSKCMI